MNDTHGLPPEDHLALEKVEAVLPETKVFSFPVVAWPKRSAC